MPDIRDSVRDAIQRALQATPGDSTPQAKGFVPQLQATTSGVPPSPEAVELLQRAQESLAAIRDDEVAGDFIHTEDPDLAILMSALEASMEPEDVIAAKREVAGLHKYDTTDPQWVLCLINELIRDKVPFITPKKLTDFQVKLPDQDLSIAMCGDWGTGLWTSTQIGNYMKAQNPDLTIHLGDVYYSGTEQEIRDKFLKRFPLGRIGSFALNSNHEMYTGGHGYFNVTLKHPAFAANQKASYFCLYNKAWQIIGLDTAYEADKRNKLYQNGWLGPDQLQWLEYQLEQGANAKRRTIILTHHNPVDINGSVDQKFLDQILGAAKYFPFHYWYWGHEHDAAVFRVFNWNNRPVYGRCIGHGGIPYAPEAIGATSNPAVYVEWTEQEKYAEGRGDTRCGLNGFGTVTIPIAGERLIETYYDDSGRRRYGGTYPAAQTAAAATLPVSPQPTPNA